MGSSMKLCFVIYSYFPYGGQQRDFMRILKESLARGHSVDVFALRWEGEVPEGVTLHLAPVRALTRTRLYKKFTRWFERELSRFADAMVVGFNKMPHLDVYYAADPCFAEMAAEQRPSYYRFTSRFAHFSEYEAAVFGADSGTEVLYLSPQQRAAFRAYYPACESRLHALPAGLAEDRRPEDRTTAGRRARHVAARARLAEELAVDAEKTLILQIGSGFRVKGVDRALRAIAALPAARRERVHYLLVGSGKPKPYLALARKLGIGERVSIVGGRDDVPALLAAGDLMFHPAYRESAGYTLLEAVVAGLPVLTTATCGYAYHIEQARAGRVCGEPITQEAIDAALAQTLDELAAAPWSENGLAYGADDSLFSLPQAAVDFIERFEKGLPRG